MSVVDSEVCYRFDGQSAGFDLSLKRLACLATLKSSDTIKYFVDNNIYIYIYILLSTKYIYIYIYILCG